MPDQTTTLHRPLAEVLRHLTHEAQHALQAAEDRAPEIAPLFSHYTAQDAALANQELTQALAGADNPLSEDDTVEVSDRLLPDVAGLIRARHHLDAGPTSRLWSEFARKLSAGSCLTPREAAIEGHPLTWQSANEAEGWTLARIYSQDWDDQLLIIERLPGSAFASNEDALRFVQERARAGSERHQQCLALITAGRHLWASREA